jgi:endoglucanase
VTATPAVRASAGPAGAGTALPTAAGGNPLAGRPFYAVPGVQANTAARAIRATRPADAALLDRIAGTPTAIWLGSWNPTSSVRANVTGIVAGGRFAAAIPILTIYRLPAHDCRGYSFTGPDSPTDYRAWIGQVVAGITQGPVAVVLEPGVLGTLNCLAPADVATTYTLLREAATALTRAGATVYLDISDRILPSAAEAARRLKLAGVADVRGFALNTSQFAATSATLRYGEAVVAQLGTGSHFVVDTSRNGAGGQAIDSSCNPPGQALGTRPTTATGSAGADALLWVKMPGESDGTCNGGPAAGTFWTDYAVGLASRAAW